MRKQTKRPAKREYKLRELFMDALYKQAAADAGLFGPKVDEAAQNFTDALVRTEIKVFFPKGTHLRLGDKSSLPKGLNEGMASSRAGIRSKKGPSI